MLSRNKKTAIWRFFYVFIFVYRNPLARQHADAADFQSAYCAVGARKSRHGCQPEQFFCVPVPEHFAYLRSEQVWLDTLPVSVVQRTTTFWFFASFLPNSLDDITWYALADDTVRTVVINIVNIFFIVCPPFILSCCVYYTVMRL